MALTALLRALEGNRIVAEYIVTELAERRSYVMANGGGGRVDSTLLRAQVFVDSRVGRGRAEIEIGGEAAAEGTDHREIAEQVQAAARRARSHQGPPWRLLPPAAPARVDVRDFEVDGREEEVASRLFETVSSVAGRSPLATWARTTQTRCILSSGFDNRYRATEVGVQGRVGGGRSTERFESVARRVDALRLKAVVAAARRRHAREPQRAKPGRYRLVVRSSAFGRAPADSIFAPLLQLSDPERYRLGTGRARLGQPVASPSLSLVSDGTRPFGLMSRPFSDDGAATRRWSVVDGGRLAGLSLGSHYGGLLERESNGGIANLELRVPRAPATDIVTDDRLPVLIVDGASWMRTDPATGRLSMAINRGRVVDEKGEATDVRGGVLSALPDLFADPRGSIDDAASPWFQGPATLRLGVVQLT